jgi:uncharacterized protein (TIGR03118 family)
MLSLKPTSHAPARLRRSIRIFSAIAGAALFSLSAMAQTSSYVQTNLISDGAVAAAHTDPNLINPWGLSIGADFWIDSPGSGLSLVTDASGNSSFDVAVPAAVSTSAHGSPSGTVFNADSTVFMIPGGTSAAFLFATLDGSIAAWNTSTPEAVTVVNNSAAKASYTDIVVDKNSTGTFLLAANFGTGTVDVFDSKFAPAKLAGTFTDPKLPTGFAPFGIHSIGQNVYVTYAQIDPSTGREVVGAGLGYVDLYDSNGNFIQTAISQGNLNAPWGMALAPAGFGSFGGDLLVGNFGDGTINAYDPTSFALKGQLQDSTGAPITNIGLWEIVFGTGTSGAGDPNTLYIAAGINSEKDGVVAAVTVGSPAGSTGDFTFQSSATTLSVATGQAGSLMLTLTGSNGFSGPVTFSCSGLPTGDACTFTPATVTLAGTTPATVGVSIGTATASGTSTTGTPTTSTPYQVKNAMPLGSRTGMTLALISPLGLLAFVGFRRKSTALRGSLFVLMVAVLSIAVTGCSSSASPKAAMPAAPTTPAAPAAPAATSVVINATAGSITHSVTVALTVQ